MSGNEERDKEDWIILEYGDGKERKISKRKKEEIFNMMNPMHPTRYKGSVCPICNIIIADENLWKKEHSVCLSCYNGTSQIRPPLVDNIMLGNEDEEDDDEWDDDDWDDEYGYVD